MPLTRLGSLGANLKGQDKEEQLSDALELLTLYQSLAITVPPALRDGAIVRFPNRDVGTLNMYICWERLVRIGVCVYRCVPCTPNTRHFFEGSKLLELIMFYDTSGQTPQ
jgi:hypothetical protein